MNLIGKTFKAPKFALLLAEDSFFIKSFRVSHPDQDGHHDCHDSSDLQTYEHHDHDHDGHDHDGNDDLGGVMNVKDEVLTVSIMIKMEIEKF